MLSITIPGVEVFDDATQRFMQTETVTLELEHSLVSLSKWEQRFNKAFLGDTQKTTEETYGYIEAMCLTEPTPEQRHAIRTRLTNELVKEINDYIESKQTATTIREMPGAPRNKEIVTNEIIYFWMSSLQIDKECENWHLNRLIMLIRVINEKNKKPKKMSKAEVAAQHRNLNAERRAAAAAAASNQ